MGRAFAHHLSIALAISLATSFIYVPGAHADAYGAPGISHRWASALKQAVGTAYESQGAVSPVWFTVADGILTEVFYPSVDQAQIGDLQFLVTDGQGYFSEQKRDTISKVSFLNEQMTVRISSQERLGRYAIEQDIVTDSAAPVLRIHTTFRPMIPGLRLYVLFKPAVNNKGSHNAGFSNSDGLFATRISSGRQTDDPKRDGSGARPEPKPTHLALVSSESWASSSVGYVGFSDGWQDLSRNFRLTPAAREAGPGNIALTGEIALPASGDLTFDLAVGFGATASEAHTYARTSLTVPFEKIRASYEEGWSRYLSQLLKNLAQQGKRFLEESGFARRSALLIKMHEDKRTRGAIVASLSKPGLMDNDAALDGTGGYHVVWTRDLYHAATGLLAAGDHRTPVDALKYCVQRQRKDGSWAQNFWVDGTPYWPSLQLDEVAYPILLAGQLHMRGVYHLQADDLEMIRKAAAFIIQHGPTTPLDRWEELGGYVPATLAAEIAALRVATAVTGDPAAAAIAERWQSLVESWTLTTVGPHGRNYYLRLSLSGNPDEPEPIELANGAGKAFASEIIDGGFLELVRLGIRNANDPRILSTLQIYESPELGISASDPTSFGSMVYRRYNGDVYGDKRVGGYWPLLAGERGHYAVAAGNIERARAQLLTLERSALESDLLPEQLSTPPATSQGSAAAGRGVASPLVWAHAEDIRLHRSIEEGIIFDLPRSTH